MLRPIISLLAATAMVAVSAAPAMADGYDHHGYDHHGYDHGGYGYGDGYGHGDYYGHHEHHDDAGTAIAVGVGIIGLIAVASALSNQNRHQQRVEHYPNNDTGPSGGWYNPDTASGPRYATNDRANNDRFNDGNSFDASSCVQTREYQTRVTIGGHTRDAYGTACLQADGSWLRGPLSVDR